MGFQEPTACPLICSNFGLEGRTCQLLNSPIPSLCHASLGGLSFASSTLCSEGTAGSGVFIHMEGMPLGAHAN